MDSGISNFVIRENGMCRFLEEDHAILLLDNEIIQLIRIQNSSGSLGIYFEYVNADSKQIFIANSSSKGFVMLQFNHFRNFSI